MDNATTNRSEEIAAIAAKIRALLGKTIENGCTEAEALLAATKAQQLMEKHQLSMTETELKSEEVSRDYRPSQGRIDAMIRNLMCCAIADFTDCRVYLHSGWINGKNNSQTVYVGLKTDVDFARWLHDSLSAFIDRGAIDAAKHGFDRRTFAMGAASRVAGRLRELTKARKTAAAQHKGTGTDLVIVTKSTMVQAYMDRNVGKLRTNRSSMVAGKGDGSFAAGQSYGNGASFGRPVSGNAGALRIR